MGNPMVIKRKFTSLAKFTKPLTTGGCALFACYSRQFNGGVSILNSWFNLPETLGERAFPKANTQVFFQ